LKILKRDAVGRVSYSAGQREAILDEFERSGLKWEAFARMTGRQYQTFASWIQRRRHERGDYQMAAPALKESRRPVPVVRLMEAVMAGPVHPEAEGEPSLRLEMRYGTQLLVADGTRVILAGKTIQTRAAAEPCRIRDSQRIFIALDSCDMRAEICGKGPMVCWTLGMTKEGIAGQGREVKQKLRIFGMR